MNKTFSFDHISTSFISTSDQVLMNAARYQARVIKSRAISTLDGSATKESLVKFSLILAHVVDAKGFPFAVPDPFAHPETVGLAWDVYMTQDPALWNQLLNALETPATIAQEVGDKLPEAISEMDAVSAHNTSPFKRTQNVKNRKSR